MTLSIQGKRFRGLLDTGADTSIISTTWWPAGWPLIQSSQSLQGLGYEDAPKISAKELHWQNEEGKRGTMIPYVLSLPINLWGRDVLQQLDFTLLMSILHKVKR